MSLLKEIAKSADTNELIESAAAGSTSASAVAGVRGRIGDATSEKTKLFARNIPKYFKSRIEEEETDWDKEVSDFRKRAKKDEEDNPDRPRRKKRRARSMRMSGPVGGAFSFSFEGSRSINEGPEDEKFDPSDVISKLRAAQEKANKEDETAGFALEDADGQIVKVYVAQDEAEDFERALAAALSGEEGENEDGEEEVTSLEIAEVLFNLKDRYSIVDVVWPPVDGDPEEQETTGEGEGDLEDDTDIDAEGGEGGEGGEVDDSGSLEDAEGDMEADLQADGEGGEGEDLEGGDEEADTKSALDAVIDLLRAQADAQKAEANAKEAEANAEEAKSNASVAELKMKQEEEVLDMEAHGDKVKKAKDEANKLKDLAKWRHKTAQTADDALNADTLDADVTATKEVDIDVEPPGEEEEEHVAGNLPGEEIPGNKFEVGFDENRNGRMSPGEFIKYIFQHQRAQ